MTNVFEYCKWLASGCFLIATFVMFSPTLAATSIIPWVLYLIGNIIWLADSIHYKNKPWIMLATIFCIMDIVLIWSRVYNVDLLKGLQ